MTSNKYYTTRLFDFLRRLAANNNREWFHANKIEFDDLRAMWMADLERLIAAMSLWDSRLGTLTPRQCAYRIYRDTRFSLDKTPYKTYFSASFGPGGRMEHRPGYYLHMDPREGEGGLYGGIWCPEAPVLKKLRKAIVDNIEEFEEIIHEPRLEKHFGGWCSESLKTAPKGWPKDHPCIELLRLKDYGKMCRKNEDFFADPSWPEKSAELYALLKPLNDFLDYSINEE